MSIDPNASSIRTVFISDDDDYPFTKENPPPSMINVHVAQFVEPIPPAINLVMMPSRELIADNYYAYLLAKKVVPKLCNRDYEFVRHATIRNEGERRKVLYILSKVGLIPCAYADPTTFFITSTAAFVFGICASGYLELGFPALTDQKREWKDYFEATAILKEDVSRWVIRALVVEALANTMFACLWPEDMVWYNASAGLMLGMILGRLMFNREAVRRMTHRVQRTESIIHV